VYRLILFLSTDILSFPFPVVFSHFITFPSDVMYSIYARTFVYIQKIIWVWLWIWGSRERSQRSTPHPHTHKHFSVATANQANLLLGRFAVTYTRADPSSTRYKGQAWDNWRPRLTYWSLSFLGWSHWEIKRSSAITQAIDHSASGPCSILDRGRFYNHWRSHSHTLDADSKCKKKSYSCNRPRRPIGLWDIVDPTLFRQSAHRWR
jgi:hypothetical protein